MERSDATHLAVAAILLACAVSGAFPVGPGRLLGESRGRVVTGYDRRQLLEAERVLAGALQQVRLARLCDDEAEVLSRCHWGVMQAEAATRILDLTVNRIDRRRAAP